MRFVQLFHVAWDQHKTLTKDLRTNCAATDRASAALVTISSSAACSTRPLSFGVASLAALRWCRGAMMDADHHNRSFTLWLAGGGFNAANSHGETDELGFNVVRDPVHVHDLHATLLHQLSASITKKLLNRFQGRDFRLTDVHGHVVKDILG